jgi:DNA-directed RNA polymerase specialized sigma24 family protein
MEKALEIVIRRALEQIRKRSPRNVQAAVGAGSPFDGINPDSLQSSEGLKCATKRIVRNALPGLRLEFERLTS